MATFISDKPTDDPILTVVKSYDRHTKLYTVFDPDNEAKIKFVALVLLVEVFLYLQGIFDMIIL